MKIAFLRFAYHAMLAGMPSIINNPINKNTLHVPLMIEPESTYLNFKLTSAQTAYLNEYIGSELEIIPVKLFAQDVVERNYLSINIYNCSSTVFMNNERSTTRCEINTYVRDKMGNVGTLIIDYLSNELSMDPVNIFKVKEKTMFQRNNDKNEIFCSSVRDDVELKTSIQQTNTIRGYLNEQLIRFSDNIYYKNGIVDKLYYDSTLVNADVQIPLIPKCFTFRYKDLVFTDIDSIFFFTNEIRFIGAMWSNLY
jgi:hypothetical protein